VLITKHPVPSLNALFAMTHWQRHREKKATLTALLSALSPSALAYSMPTTWWEDRSILRTAYDTLASYQAMQKRKSVLKSASKKLSPKQRNAPKSKSNRSTKRQIQDMTRAELIEAYWDSCFGSWNRSAFDALMETLSDSDLRQYIQMGTT